MPSKAMTEAIEMSAKLTADLLRAKAAGERAASKVDDVGTCNRDSLYIVPERINPLLRRAVKAATEAVGMTGRWCKHYGEVCFDFGPSWFGQGQRNTEAVSAMAGSLRADRWSAHVFYITD